MLLIYSRLWQADFIAYDDTSHVVENEHVRTGLSAANVAWAFTHHHAAQYTPLTWISHMLDVTLFGMDPGAHHLVNVAFHLVNALLLFGVLARMTGTLWRSACVAALFAVHPLNVESVAWIAERKSVLNTMCWFLAIGCYARYAEKLRPQWLVATALAMAAGLLTKAMIVTLPFALLLLDGWPLRRIGVTSWRRLVLEKLPLFALTAAGCLVQMRVGAAATPLWGAEATPFGFRLANAAAAPLVYLGQLFVPLGLAVPYPPPVAPPILVALTSVLVFAGLFLLAWRRRGPAPYLLIGLLWFLGTLFPVSGIVQLGDTVFANRFTYLPQLGIFCAAVWTIEVWLRGKDRLIAPALAGGVVTLFAVVSARYVACWENSTTLFTHAARVLPASPQAQGNAGIALAREGRLQEALPYYRAALAVKPHDPEIRGNLGVALSKLNDLDGAIAEFRQAAGHERRPGVASFNLGTHLLRNGDTAEAIPVLERVSAAAPDNALAHFWLGRAYETAGRPDDAIREYREALARKPDDASIQDALRRLVPLLKAI